MGIADPDGHDRYGDGGDGRRRVEVEVEIDSPVTALVIALLVVIAGLLGAILGMVAAYAWGWSG